MIKETSNENQIKIINNVRNYLYNLLFNSIENGNSSEDETETMKSSRRMENSTVEESRERKRSLEDSFQFIEKS